MNYIYLINVNHKMRLDSSILSKDMINHISRYKNEEDYRRSYIAYYYLTKTVMELFEMDITKLPLKYNDYGKPYFDGFYFNISHSKGLVALAISNEEVGIDIQEIKELAHLDSMAKKILTIEQFENYLKAEDKNLYVLKSFSKKESYLKKIGTGFKNDFKVEAIDTSTEIVYDNHNVSYVLSITPKKNNVIEWI